MGIDSFFSLIQTLIVLIIVIVLANFLLKYLNKYMLGKNKIVKIIERVCVNKNSYISIVDICGKYYLMSFSEEGNEILRELDQEEIGYFVDSLEEEGTNYLEMGRKFAKKISIHRTNNNLSDDIDSTDHIS